MRHLNVLTTPVETDPDDPEGYRAGMDRFGPRLGAQRFGGSVYVLPPGQSVCPYHYEYGCEEWLVVLTGTLTLRDPDGERELEAGDLVLFVEGPQGAHRLTNRGEADARLLLFSTKQDPAIVVYPDSGQIAAFTGSDDGDDDVRLFREDGARGYYEREPG